MESMEKIQARRGRWESTQECWRQFAEKFLVGKGNFLFEGGDKDIFNPDTIKGVMARYDSLRGKNKDEDFLAATREQYGNASRAEKLVFAHALFAYKLIIKMKNADSKMAFVNCLGLGDFVDGLYWNGCTTTGPWAYKKCSISVDFILNAFNFLAGKNGISRVEDANKAIRDFCENDYKTKDADSKQTANALLWYVAGDEYEPILSQGDKQAIANCPAFMDLIKDDPAFSADMLKDALEQNKVIALIRKAFGKKIGREKFNFYDGDVKGLWKLEEDASAAQNERGYRKWMEEVKLLPNGEKPQPRTINGYARTLRSKKDQLNSLAKELELLEGGSFFGISDKDDFENVKKELEASAKFTQMNKDGNNHYSSALESYGEYLAYAEEKRPKESGGNTMTKNENPTKQTPLNRIFYGPPGTGKTFHAIPAALGIIGDVPSGRETQMEKFNELRNAGQIAMVTFHQNFSYEDFIEGIKPVLDSEENDLSYEMSAGIFKQIAVAANKNRKDSVDAGRRSDVDGLVNEYARYVEHSDEDIFIDNKGKWKIERVTRYSNEEFRSFYILRANTNAKSGQRLTLEVIEEHYENFEKGKIKSPADIPPKFASKSAQHGNAPYYFAFFQKLKEFKESRGISFSKESVERKNYVLIIDEINRGNISAIFGELITLIEDDKRLGKGNVNALELTLPYSKEPFGVPDNLHIIGTMNTADRSIAMLDTALRRRFHFVEMMPKPELLSEDVGGVNCRLLLEKINARIKAEYDREHQIGHAFLMGVEGIDDLKDKFQHKIIPLLQEYFFDDWEKIAKVLNKNRFIREEKQEGEDADKKLFELLPFGDEAWDKAENYQEIYKKKNLQADDE